MRDLSRPLYVSFADASAAFSNAQGVRSYLHTVLYFAIVAGLLMTAMDLGAATTLVSDLTVFVVYVVDVIVLEGNNTPGGKIVVAGGETAALAIKDASSTGGMSIAIRDEEG
jgi:hypothetical protein